MLLPHQFHLKNGKVSRYAWGDDYHEVVGDKLRQLLNWIREQWPAAKGKVCVDIQSTMDKAWAVRAGLGWMGKHTNVITREYGSWVFIGELLLNLELEYDEDQIADQCGSCTLCIDACPTGTIVEPYLLDANRCISHATIESRAPEIRPDVAANLEGWLYGCDICQDVCPWNHTSPVTHEASFEPREGNVNTSLSGILELTPEAYAADAEIELAIVKSPIVGTFYRSSEPGAAAFVEVGTSVKKGDVLCIIEAMKLMNEIDSEYDGEITNVYVENGQPVQYGERLFAIRTR